MCVNGLPSVLETFTVSDPFQFIERIVGRGWTRGSGRWGGRWGQWWTWRRSQDGGDPASFDTIALRHFRDPISTTTTTVTRRRSEWSLILTVVVTSWPSGGSPPAARGRLRQGLLVDLAGLEVAAGNRSLGRLSAPKHHFNTTKWDPRANIFSQSSFLCWLELLRVCVCELISIGWIEISSCSYPVNGVVFFILVPYGGSCSVITAAAKIEPIKWNIY